MSKQLLLCSEKTFCPSNTRTVRSIGLKGAQRLQCTSNIRNYISSIKGSDSSEKNPSRWLKKPKSRASYPKVLKPQAALHLWSAHKKLALGIHFGSSIDDIFTCGKDGCVRQWKIKSRNANIDHRVMRLFPAYNLTKKNQEGGSKKLNFLCSSTSKRGLLATGNNKGVIQLWNSKSGKCIHAYTDHSLAVSSLAFMPELSRFSMNSTSSGALLISGSYDESIKVWDPTQGRRRCVRTLGGHSGCVTSLDCASKGSIIVSGGSDCEIKLWDLRACGACVATLCDRGSLYRCGKVMATKFQPGHNLYNSDYFGLASACDHGDVCMWDLRFSKQPTAVAKTQTSEQREKQREKLKSRTKRQDLGLDIILNSDSDSKYTSSIENVIKRHQNCNEKTLGVSDISFTSDGSVIAIAGVDKAVQLWRITPKNTLAFLHRFEGHPSSVTGVSFGHNTTFQMATKHRRDNVSITGERKEGLKHITSSDNTQWLQNRNLCKLQILGSCDSNGNIILWDVAPYLCAVGKEIKAYSNSSKKCRKSIYANRKSSSVILNASAAASAAVGFAERANVKANASIELARCNVAKWSATTAAICAAGSAVMAASNAHRAVKGVALVNASLAGLSAGKYSSKIASSVVSLSTMNENLESQEVITNMHRKSSHRKRVMGSSKLPSRDSKNGWVNWYPNKMT